MLSADPILAHAASAEDAQALRRAESKCERWAKALSPSGAQEQLTLYRLGFLVPVDPRLDPSVAALKVPAHAPSA
jgi:hypothetical protein